MGYLKHSIKSRWFGTHYVIEYVLFKNYFFDLKDISKTKPFGPIGTFNGFHFDKPVTKRIDYVFVSKSNIKVLKYTVLSDSAACRYPSGHLPVYIEIQFTETN